MAIESICLACGALYSGRCPCRGVRDDGRTVSARRLALEAVWKSARWERRRLEIFERDHWRCRDCGFVGETRTGRGLVCDHVHGFEGPDDPAAWADWNLATRCRSCSGKKDGGRRREQGARTARRRPRRAR